MKLSELGLSEEQKNLLAKALDDKGHYYSSIFISDISYKKSEDPKYDFEVEVCKWNTRSAWVVRLRARFDSEANRYLINYLRRGKTGRIASEI